jgi:hypothetical protein
MPLSRTPSLARTLLAAAALVLLAACSGDLATPTAPKEPTAGPSFFTYPSAVYHSHVEFGVPRDANAADDLLLSKRTHYVSYNCTRGRPTG